MLKLTRFFYIHLAVIPLFVAAWLAHALNTTAMAYGIVAVHELSHLFAALLLGIRVKSIIVMPFGITLRLADGYIREPWKEVLVSLAGPLANLLMALIGMALRTVYPWAEESLFFFIGLNVVMLLLNLVPALPLDGGRVLKALLTQCWGYLAAFNLLRHLSRILAVVLLAAGAALLYVTHFNATLLLVGGFLFFHVAEERKNHNLIIMKEILYSKDKLRRRGMIVSKTVSALHSVPARKLVRLFSYQNFYIVHVIDDELRPVGCVTESQVVDAMTRRSVAITVGDVLTESKKTRPRSR